MDERAGVRSIRRRRRARRLSAFIAAQGVSEVRVGRAQALHGRLFLGDLRFPRVLARKGASRSQRDLILRVGPPNGIFAPYKASPEFITLRALPAAACRCRGSIGTATTATRSARPFFICEFVRGEAPIPWTADGGPAFDEARAKISASQFVAALAALHQFRMARHAGRRDRRRDGSRRRPRAAQIDLWERLLAQWSTAPRADARMGGDLASRARAGRAADQRRARRFPDRQFSRATTGASPRSSTGSWCVSAIRSRISAGSACRRGAAARPICAICSRARNCASAIQRADRASASDLARGALLGGVRHLQARGDASTARRYCFETRGFNDLRMAGMGAQIPRMLLQVESAMERAA